MIQSRASRVRREADFSNGTNGMSKLKENEPDL